MAIGNPFRSGKIAVQELTQDYHVDITQADLEAAAANRPAGVERAQASASGWSKISKTVVYVIIWLIYFVASFHVQMVKNLAIYVTSSFYGAPLVTTASVLAMVINGVFKLPLAKILDNLGRPTGFAIVIGLEILGLILLAACANVETYAAGYVLYWLGGSSMVYVLEVVMADITPLAWRGFFFAFAQTPTIITTFAGPAAAQSYLQTSGWRWAFGTFAILVPVVAAPLLFMLIKHERGSRSEKAIVPTEKSHSPTLAKRFYNFLVDFDVLGMFLLCAGVVLFLLPMTLASYRQNRWNSPAIISMLVIGIVLIIVFGLYERLAAKKPFLPFHLLVDRTVIGSCLLVGVMYVSVYCWELYFSPYLQVVYNLGVRDAGYVANFFDLGSIFWGLLVGLIIRWTGRVKWLAVAAVPLQILGTGLMIYFRQPGHSIGFILMCQVFVAVAAGTILACSQVAIMAAVGQDNNASALALIAVFVAFGGAIGTAVSGAVWTGTLPGALVQFLPDNAKSRAATFYLSLPAALANPPGSPVRQGIMEAYAFSQQYMCVAAVALLPLCLVFVLMWRDEDIKKHTLAQAEIRTASTSHAGSEQDVKV